MSGGSMDYLCYKVDDASFVENTPARKAFKRHLSKVAKALRAIEWNDSGDGDSTEEAAIMACITKTEMLQEAVRAAEAARNELDAAIQAAR